MEKVYAENRGMKVMTGETVLHEWLEKWGEEWAKGYEKGVKDGI